jgi:hypothetical protein
METQYLIKSHVTKHYHPFKNIQISDYMIIAILKNPSPSQSMKAENLQQCYRKVLKHMICHSTGVKKCMHKKIRQNVAREAINKQCTY